MVVIEAARSQMSIEPALRIALGPNIYVRWLLNLYRQFDFDFCVRSFTLVLTYCFTRNYRHFLSSSV